MFCPNCGNQVADNVKFCPNCGSALRPQPQTAPTDPAAGRPGYGAGDPTAPVIRRQVPDKKRAPKSKKNVLAPIIAVVVVVALVIGGVALAFGGSRAGYKKENVFASQMKNTKKDSSARDLMTILAALHNTAFNSKSLTASVIVDGDEDLFKGCFSFGNSLTSTKLLFDVYDGDYYLAMRDGKLMVVDVGYDAHEFDVPGLLKDADALVELIPNKNEAPDAVQKLFGQTDAIKKTVEKLFSGKLDYASVNQLSDYAYQFLSSVPEYARLVSQTEGVALDDLLGIVADCVAQLPDDVIEITADKNGDETRYSYSFNAADALEYLIDYFFDSEQIASLLSAEANQNSKEYLSEYRSEIEDDLGSLIFKGEITLSGKYISGATCYYGYNGREELFRAKITGINDTEIADSKLDKVFNSVAADDVYRFASAEDVAAELDY